MSFGAPKMPAVQPIMVTSPAPTPTDTAAQQAAQQVATQQAQAGGRASTILTSGTGVPTQPTVQRKTLLGQ